MSDVKKALESTDVKLIKKVRGSEKGKLTKYVDRIHEILRVDEATGSYDHESISRIELSGVEISVKEAFKNTQDLHSHLQCNRAEGANAEEESKIEDEMAAYSMSVDISTTKALN